MIRRRRMLAAKVHLPLRQLALCLDCDECFEISSPTCPACGSVTWTSLSGFLARASSARHPGHRDAVAKRPDDPPEMVRQLIIVAGACARSSTRYCARLAGPSCPWMSQRIISETLPASDRSRWRVAKTNLSPQGG